MCGVFVAACLTPVQFTSPTAPPGGSLDDLCKSTGVPRYAEDGLEAYWSKAKKKKKAVALNRVRKWKMKGTQKEEKKNTTKKQNKEVHLSSCV